ncbi:B-lymphocyte antigen CD20 isoform X2 [Peromyscus eremicus]|uniref:B-lymphocyte antigen CD20 isoform X2 n=1 Tax=Peromyscus eremicus TaxID=42410 RepID=UPI0027DCE0ED|nr:B-lymphocyte antigen CD20 isoform X2 [Peromyscus eremicus]
MDSNNMHSPVFLVLPPEVTSQEYQATGLTATAYDSQKRVQKILIRKLKILGTVQILFGIMNFSFGVVFLFTLVNPYPRFPFIFISGYPFWGSALFINSGAFLIALKRKTTDTLELENRMTTPRNSVSGTFPIESTKGPLAMQPSQKVNLRRTSSLVGPTQSFFMRESKALGAVQIMNGLFHISLGGLLLIPTGVFAPISVSVWYPLWGGLMYIISGSLLAASAEQTSRKSLVKAKVIMSSLSLFAAISGIILSIMDILNITVSHFLKMERLDLSKTPNLYVDIYNCEPSNSSEKNSPSTRYCYSMQSVFLGILSVMLIFAFFQKLVTAGIVENEWKRMCSRPKSNVVLLSAGEKKEQTIKMKEEIIELSGVSSQPKNEEEIEIIPVQEEEEEETEINFPEPPQEQESLPVENEISP